MIANALEFLLNTLFGLFSFSVLLRFYLQLTGAPFQNPVSQAVVALTNFAVIPTRKVIPSWRGLDLSTLLLAYVTELILQLSVLVVRGFPLLVAGGNVWVAMLGLALIGVIKLSIYLFMYAVILQALLSWVNPYTAITPALNALTNPILKPLRKRMPMPSGLDLTPLAVFIVAQLLLILFVTPLEQHFLKLF